MDAIPIAHQLPAAMAFKRPAKRATMAIPSTVMHVHPRANWKQLAVPAAPLSMIPQVAIAPFPVKRRQTIRSGSRYSSHLAYAEDIVTHLVLTPISTTFAFQVTRTKSSLRGRPAQSILATISCKSKINTTMESIALIQAPMPCI
jgi:hypothetical protein